MIAEIAIFEPLSNRVLAADSGLELNRDTARPPLKKNARNSLMAAI
jgi:hypothetical protein